eukprot:symbB.v1.2.021393.t1/scaffold1840.1/size99223/7
MVPWWPWVVHFYIGAATPEPLALLGEELGSRMTSRLKRRLEEVLLYHWRSKHFLDVQAALPEKLDWSTQPSPWRSYLGAPIIQLPTTLPKILEAPLSLASLGSFLRLGAGISAWKSYDGIHAWALRVAPSSGNLQTTEVHLVLPPMEGLANVPAVYHYQPEMHRLEIRLQAPQELIEGDGESSDCFLVILSSLCVREAWKYGERALRSCHLNLGHMLQALAASCELHGWILEEGPRGLQFQEVLRQILDLKDETPEVVLRIRRGTCQTFPQQIESYQAQFQSFGEVSPLSATPGTIYPQWPVMDAAQDAIELLQEDLGMDANMDDELEVKQVSKTRCLLGHLGDRLLPSVLQRRSALSFVETERKQFPQEEFLMLLRASCECVMEIQVVKEERKIHLLIMLHDVEGFQPGLYVLLRGEGEKLRSYVEMPMTEVLDLHGCKLWMLTAADLLLEILMAGHTQGTMPSCFGNLELLGMCYTWLLKLLALVPQVSVVSWTT